MAQHALLNNVEHKNLKIRQDHGPQYNENLMCVPVFPAEARLAQAHYPLLFAKDNDNQFQMVALLGFEQGENLFLQDGQWQAAYQPMVIAKGPFLIGRNDQQPEQLSVHIDLDDPRVNESEGEAVFLPHGGTTEYTDTISNVLSTLHESQQPHRDFIAACEALNLIESFVLDIDMPDSGTHRLSGFYTVNEERLNQLDGEQLAGLLASGHLDTLYMMLASMSQMASLVRRKKAVS